MKEVLNEDFVLGGIDGCARSRLGRWHRPGLQRRPERGHVLRRWLRRWHRHRPGEHGPRAWRDDRLVRFPSASVPPTSRPRSAGTSSRRSRQPGVKEFIEYMTTAEAGEVWAATGAIISPVKAVSTDVYPNDSVKREAAQVAGATLVRFDGSDLLPAGTLISEPSSRRRSAARPWTGRVRGQVAAAWASEYNPESNLEAGGSGLPPLSSAARRVSMAGRGADQNSQTMAATARKRRGAGCGGQTLARRARLLRPGRVPAPGVHRLSLVYTILLCFNRGRSGEFTEWLGLDNFMTLFTEDPNFINLGTFPPSGALWNNVLWIIFYTSLRAPRPDHRDDGDAGPVRVGHQGDRLPAEGDRGDGAGGHLELRVCARPEHRSPQRTPWCLQRRTGLAGSAIRIVNAALIAVGTWASVGFATVILSAAIKGIPRRSSRRDGPTARASGRSSSGSSCRWSACRSPSWPSRSSST